MQKSGFILPLLGSLAFVAIGVLMVVEKAEGGWGVLSFFGLCAAVLVWRMVRSEIGPRLVIDERGVYDRSLGLGVILWEDVKDAKAVWVSGHSLLRSQPFLCLTLRDPEAYLQRVHPAKRFLARAGRAFVSADLSIALGDLKGVDAEVLARLIRRQAAEGTTGYRWRRK